MKLQQVSLTKYPEKRICWVDTIEKLKAGRKVRLKDETELWVIEKVYDTIVDKEEINRTWKVGGI
jgi:hypothetical protein